jgi:hypothetical protein
MSSERSPVVTSINEGVLSEWLSILPDTASDTDIKEAMDDLITDQLAARMDKADHKFAKIKADWSAPFIDIEANYALLVSDLKRVNEKVKLLSVNLGTAQLFKVMQPQSAWDGLVTSDSAMESMEKSQTLLLDQIASHFENFKQRFFEVESIKPSLLDLHNKVRDQGSRLND